LIAARSHGARNHGARSSRRSAEELASTLAVSAMRGAASAARIAATGSGSSMSCSTRAASLTGMRHRITG
jgi:hypothetical protein